MSHYHYRKKDGEQGLSELSQLPAAGKQPGVGLFPYKEGRAKKGVLK